VDQLSDENLHGLFDASAILRGNQAFSLAFWGIGG